MLEKFIGVQCSRASELLLAFTYVRDRDHLLAAAKCLQLEERNAAMRLAQMLSEMPTREAEALSHLILQQNGLCIGKTKGRV